MKNKLLVTISVVFVLSVSCIAVAAQGPCKEDSSIRSVTKARVGNLETVTFVVNSATPDYEVRSARPPFNYGEGERRLNIRGRYFQQISFKSVFWTCTIAENFKARTSEIMDVKQDDQFEGYVGYVIGYRDKARYAGVTKTIGRKTSKIILKFRR